MNQQDNTKPNKTVIEDLVVNQDQAEEVKGGDLVTPPSWGLDRIDQR